MIQFGKPAIALWPLDPAATYLNHGTVGVTPKRVLEIQQQWRDRIEKHPSRFMLRDVWTFSGVTPDGPTLLRRAAAQVAAFVGADADNLVFIDNTTTGVNAIVRSLPLEAGDEILITDHAYGGIVAAIRYAADRAGATVNVINVPYPAFDRTELVRRIEGALTPHTRLVITDHVVSETALIFPVREIVEACHRRGVPVLVDGAHVPGALPLNVSSIGADFYVANLHKWTMAPRSCAFLVVQPAFQRSIHPAVISWGFDAGFTQEFDWVGTRDPTPWLCAPDGIAFLESIGLDAARRYNHALAWHAARYLTDAWNTPLEFDESSVGTMVTVQVPERAGLTKADAARLRDRLLVEHNIEVHAHARCERVWVRVSAQVYNDERDIELLARAVATAGSA